jgi:hypothetical protein
VRTEALNLNENQTFSSPDQSVLQEIQNVSSMQSLNNVCGNSPSMTGAGDIQRKISLNMAATPCYRENTFDREGPFLGGCVLSISLFCSLSIQPTVRPRFAFLFVECLRP